jgi:transketolase
MNTDKLNRIAKLIRYYILISTTHAGSGHPTSSLSAVELLTTLFFNGHFRYKVKDPEFPNNDRFILSKGHASPLFYSIWAVAGELNEEELKKYRDFDSPLEGHPTKRFKHTEVATGSLGQGLSVGVGMAMNAKYLDKLPYKTYVLLGDSEMSEGSNWEAVQIAAYYKLDNLVGIIDVNRLGQRGETMYGWDLEAYEKKLQAFGWDTFKVEDGHSIGKVDEAFKWASENITYKPKMIIAKTVKGKGVSFLEDKEGWHGKVLSKGEFKKAVNELGPFDKSLIARIAEPEMSDKVNRRLVTQKTLRGTESTDMDRDYDKPLATRKAYGYALAGIFPKYPEMVVLDAEVSNSTYSKTFKKAYPDNFFEMFIAEQNMVGVALGFSERGKIPFVSTFSSFFSRAHDQIRVSQYSEANINFVGSHAGVSIGEDGPTQMGLEDLAIFRTILGSTVFYPADQVACEKLVYDMLGQPGVCYMRTTRMDTPPLYGPEEKFEIGGSKTLKSSEDDKVTVVAVGVTVYEALKAYEELLKKDICIRVIDAYCVKPIDKRTLKNAAEDTKAVITVEDHFAEGGLGDAVLEALSETDIPIYKLAVTKMPRSGTPKELLEYEEISKDAIVRKVRAIIK